MMYAGASKAFLLKEDGNEHVCEDIRNAVSQYQHIVFFYCENEVLASNKSFSLEDITIGEPIGQGCFGTVYRADLKKNNKNYRAGDGIYAIKIVHKHKSQNSLSQIVTSMLHEAVPARNLQHNTDLINIKELIPNIINLPPHANIVSIHQAIIGTVSPSEESLDLFPDAKPNGIALFLLMNKYRHTLDEYLAIKKPDQKEMVVLFTQLLEAVVHMNENGVSHRDIKSDNVMVQPIEIAAHLTVPLLVVTDFGMCSADMVHGLRLPFPSSAISKGGNRALMAPEIILQEAGPSSVLNYTNADLWSVGTLAYEIFGGRNPFICDRTSDETTLLFNRDEYEKNLPSMERKTPILIQRLVKNLLQRNPKKRLNANVAANICQLFLWAPSLWIGSGYMPNNDEIIQWLEHLTARVIRECRLSDKRNQGPEDQYKKLMPNPESVLKLNFLCRLNLHDIHDAINWIHINKNN